MDKDKTIKINRIRGDSDAAKTQNLDDALKKSEDPDKTQSLADLSDSDKTQSLVDISPSSTASFDAVAEKTQVIDISEQSFDSDDGTREFPAVIADDGQAKDMTVMLAGEYAAAMGLENKDSNADPNRDDSEAQKVLEGSALVPSGETEVLPFTRKYFEQYETDEEIPEDALEPQTEEIPISTRPAPSAKYAGAHSIIPDKKNRNKRIIIAVVIGVVVLAAIIGFTVFNMTRANYEKAHEPHQIVLQVTAPEYGANDSKIPVQIEGANADGTVVSEVRFVDINGRGIELIQGDYSLTVPASPLMEGAKIYRVPDTRIRVKIDDSVESGTEYLVREGAITFDFAYLVDVTDEDIDKSYKYAVESGFDEATAQAYRDALRAKRDEELAAHRAEQEKAQRLTDTQTALTNYAQSKGTTGINYKLVDIDGDSFPEMLLAGNSSSSVGAMSFVYAYDAQSHKVVELASAAGGSNHAPSIWYSTSTHQVALTTAGPSRESYTFYLIKDTSANLVHTYVHEVTKVTGLRSSQELGITTPNSTPSSSSSSSSSASGTQDVFTLDGQTITLETYNNMIHDLSNNYYAVSAPK